MSQSLTSKTIHSVQWTTIATIVISIAQIVAMSVMARLLEPSAFGLMALAGVILRFTGYFANMGMSQAIIQKKDLSTENIQAAFTSSILLSLFFYGIIWLFAPLATSILASTEVIPIVRAMGVNFIIGGLSSTSHGLLRREMQFKKLAIIEMISYIIGYVVVEIILAYMGFGVWSLVAAALSQSLVNGIACYMLARHNLGLLFSWEHYRPLFSFGSRISLISFMEFITSNLDTMVIGRLFSETALGIYNRAYMLIQLPIQSLTTSISKVLFPALSSIQSQTERLKKVYLTAITLVGYVILPACIGASVAAEEIVLVLLGEKWTDAIPLFRILALATPFNLLGHFGGIICDANAKLIIKVYFQIFFLITLLLLFFLLKDYGLAGFATAIAIAMFIKNIAYIFITKSFLKFHFKQIIKSYIPAIIASVTVATLIYLVKLSVEGLNIYPIIILMLYVAAGIFSLVFLLLFNFNKELRNEILNRFLSKIPFLEKTFIAEKMKQ